MDHDVVVSTSFGTSAVGVPPITAGEYVRAALTTCYVNRDRPREEIAYILQALDIDPQTCRQLLDEREEIAS